MPRNAVARGRWAFVVIVLSAAFAVACDDERPVVADTGTPPPVADAALDASIVEDSGTEDAGPDSSTLPPPPWDGAVPDEELCVLRVAAQCDGAEDCGGRACCARYEPSAVSYTAIECADSCDFQQTFPLCHAGDRCTASGDTVCRTSLLIPDDFIGVCAPESPFAGPPTGKATDTIDCGSQQCIVGEEQCCLREGFNLKRFRSVKYEPYCAPIGEPCGCTEVDIPARDAGTPGDDAGL